MGPYHIKHTIWVHWVFKYWFLHESQKQGYLNNDGPISFTTFLLLLKFNVNFVLLLNKCHYSDHYNLLYMLCWKKFHVLRERRKFKSLWPSDAIWWHRSGSTLVQVMACRLTAPSHYWAQYWLIMKGVLWHSPKSDFTRSAKPLHVHEDYSFKFTTTTSRDQWVQCAESEPVHTHTLLLVV